MCANRVGSIRQRLQVDISARCQLTDRDRQLLALVALHGAVSRGQLIELGFFGSISRANRRLRLLFDGRYLRRTFLANGPYSPEAIYMLGPKAVPAVAELGVVDRIELERQARRQPERAYLEHHIGVVSSRIMLQCVPSGYRIESFLTEPECRHEYEVKVRSRTVKRIIKPDAFFEVARDADRWPYFLELDRGNCSLPQMRGAFERYGLYWREKAFQCVYGESEFEVLVVTTAGDRRIYHLDALAKDCGVAVRFAKLRDVQAQGFFAAVWQTGPEMKPEQLIPSSTPGRLP